MQPGTGSQVLHQDLCEIGGHVPCGSKFQCGVDLQASDFLAEPMLDHLLETVPTLVPFPDNEKWSRSMPCGHIPG